ncbi:MAG: efflux RND transporter periplasmic adaptor subunit [Pseudomonadota bacterium]
MAKQVAIWKQALIAAVMIAGAGFAWTERDGLSQALGIADAATAAQNNGKPRLPAVLTAPVRIALDDLEVEVVGTGRATRSVMLRAQASGRIVSLSLEPGRVYRQGEILMQLEATEERLAVELAETRLAEAERIRDRIARLETTGAATGNRVDEVRTAASIAALELQRAEQDLADRTLLAPFDGAAGLTELEIGAWVSEDTEVASLDDRTVIEVEVDLPEALLGRLDQGATVSAITAAAPGLVFEGTVVAIDSRIDDRNRAFRVRVALPNDKDRLRPGASFSVRIALPGPSYPVVPELAVQFSQGSLYVWRITDGKAEKVNVRMVRRREGSVLIEGPLAEGDEIVFEGLQRMRQGRKVEVLTQPGDGV